MCSQNPKFQNSVSLESEKRLQTSTSEGDYVVMIMLYGYKIINLTLKNVDHKNLKLLCNFDRSDHWNVLLLKEALCIKQLKPVLNHGLMASKEL